jgi:NTE family protein
VSLESGRLRYATEDGRLLEKDGSTVPDPTRVPAPCRPAAEKIAALEAEARSIEDERRDLQQELRTAPPGAKARLVAGIRALTQRLAGVSTRLAQARASLEQCRRTQPVEALRVHLPTAILASASIPGIFPPVGLGSENYVDGGIREVIPLQAAVDLPAFWRSSPDP